MKTINKRQNQIYLAIAGSILIICILVFGNYQLFKVLPAGGDFAAQWKGFQLLIQSGVSPYSSDAESSISLVIKELNYPSFESSYKFNSALYSLFFYTPFALLKEMKLAIAIWAALTEILLILTLYFVARFFRKKTPFIILILMVVFAIFSLPSFLAIMSGSSAVLTAFLLFSGALSLANGKDEIAAFLIAFSLIRADLTFIPIVFLTAWTIKSQRWTFSLWFSAVAILLTGFSMLLVPDWIIRYPLGWFKTFTDQFSRSSAIQNRLFVFISISLIILLIIEWLFSKNRSNKRIVWLVSITVTISLLLTRGARSSELVLVTPALFFGLWLLRDRWGDRISGVIYGILTLLFTSQWLTSTIIFANIPEPLTFWVLHVLYPLSVLVLLYWSRWWVIQEERLADPLRKLGM